MSGKVVFDPNDVPPAVPMAERIAKDNSAFVTECKAHIGYDMSQWVIKNAALTETDKWGLVWRLDYTEPTSPPRSISTLVCWKLGNGEWVVLRYLDRKIGS